MTIGNRRTSAITTAQLALLALAGAASLPACFSERNTVQIEVIDQDLNQGESPVADQAIRLLLQQDNVQMVFCFRDGLYEVHAREGTLLFRRTPGPERYVYEEVEVRGENPLAFQDPLALPDRAAELAAGTNPLRTAYPEQDPGYDGPDDPRIAFIPAQRMSYPLAYERIAAAFDGEHVGDLVIEHAPWGWHPMGTTGGHLNPGIHGPLNVIASRAPLIFAGKGVRKNVVLADFARSVDIAPTVAKALGVKQTYGVDESGHYSHEVYLKWQDGHVLEDVLDGETPARAVIIVNDALLHSELVHQLASDQPLQSYRWLVEHGTMYQHGAIVNFPTNTFASHNTIGSGAYSGHHGLIDNWFYDRRERERHDPLTEVIDTGKFIRDEVETLHEAIHRSFKSWDPETEPLGTFTMSINDPSTKDADHALLEGVQPIDWKLCPEPEGLALPDLDKQISMRAQAADNLGVSIFAKAFLGSYEQQGRQVRCAQPPRYAILNFGLTDDVAHEAGPHSDRIARAIAQTDQRHQVLFDVLKQANAFEDTLFVFTSDHGQLLQDEQRVRDPMQALRDAGLRFVNTHAFVYLLTFDVHLSTIDFRQGKRTRLRVTVRDDDTQEHVAGAEVTLESGDARVSATTDDHGRAELDFTPAAAETRLTIRDGEAVPEKERRNDYARTF